MTINSYNAELRDAQGYIGDRATNGAFRAILEGWRDEARSANQEDPLGDLPSSELPKKQIDKVLIEGTPEAAGIVHGAIEEFATGLARVVARFLKLKSWHDTERIVVGGGMRSSRAGELAILRTSVLLKAAGHKTELVPIHNHPDEAGLGGAIHLVPPWMLDGHDAILAVDIGGSNLRAGLVGLRPPGNGKKSRGIPRGMVHLLERWRYADERTKPSREQAVARIGTMLKRLIKGAAKTRSKLAPFIGVGCPGIIAGDGHIERGGQNLPGNWESSRFNLPRQLRELIPEVDGHETLVVMHNDAVVHGLSDLPYVQDVAHWGVLTIGTGLGNAHFTNTRRDAARK